MRSPGPKGVITRSVCVRAKSDIMKCEDYTVNTEVNEYGLRLNESAVNRRVDVRIVITPAEKNLRVAKQS